MPGLGTIVNTVAIIVSGVIGLYFGKLFKKDFEDILIKACGISVIFIGIAGALEKMLSVSNGALVTSKSMFIVLSLVIGGFLGELINIEGLFTKFGDFLKRKTNSEKDKDFIDAFITTSLTVTFGAMSIIGAINDGLYHDYSVLYTKTVLDVIVVATLSSSLGKGCIFSAIPTLLFQGLITLLSVFIQPIMTPDVISNFSMIGSILLFGVGVNLVFGKKIKVANYLPALIVAVILTLLPLGL